ncbi:aminotransferase class IV [Alkalibaculum sporogenes]|nr:aminotransferase class IV [Alkalibaculum sporogenes]
MDKKTYFSYNGKLENSDIYNITIPMNAVYEVIKMIDGKPLFFEDHVDRFMKSIQNMGYKMNITSADILQEIVLLARANMNKNTNVRLVYIPNDDKNKYDIMISFIKGVGLSAVEKEKGVAVETIEIERHNPNVKIVGTSYKDRIQSSANFIDTFELLLVNKEGYITEGSKSNVFFVKNNKVITSPANNVLLGVTRKYILEICKHNHIEVAFDNITEKEAYDMDGAFLTGTTIDIAIIRKVNNIKCNYSNKISELLKNCYEELMKNYLESFKVNQ